MDLFNFHWTGEQQRRRRNDARRFTSTTAAPLDKHDICPENEFLRLLCLERRRSERSGRPLCLVLLDGIAIVESYIRQTAFRQVSNNLRSSVRETDAIGWYKEESTMGALFSDLNSADNLVVSLLREKVMKVLMDSLAPKLASQIKISVYVFPGGKDPNAPPPDLALYPDLPHQTKSRKASHFLKRIMDIVGSSILLFMLTPLLAAVVLAIKLTSKGPVIFRQSRIGQYGIPFSFCKFRSMCVNNDASIHKDYVRKFISNGQAASNTEPVFKLTNDERITPIGRFLRKTSIDELPQLWNVLCGDMSLVGPRPPLAYEVDCYAMWHRRRILEVKPGMTGLWQVMGRSRITFNEMVRLDLRYAKRWTIWLDIKILLQTPRAVFMGEGAY
jgi:exopolysaccharide biosynthesis polyprenyl glycosylphosphotransferase